MSFVLGAVSSPFSTEYQRYTKQILPAVPLYVPILSLNPSVSLDTWKSSYFAYPFMPSQFSNSTRRLHCLDSVRLCMILLPTYTNRKMLITMIYFYFYFDAMRSLLSPRNTLRWGYSNAAVVPSVSPSVVPSVRGPCEHDRDYTVTCFFVKLGRHVNHDERMNPINFGGQRSKVKVTMDIYGNKLVNTIETKPLCASWSNLADMLAMVRGWTLLILEVGGQRSRSQWAYMEISLWTR